MHSVGLILFGGIAVFWLTHGLNVAFGAARLPWLKDFALVPESECPPVSVLFAARDEEEKLPAALATLMRIDYPRLEVIAVDDRSQDATAAILDEFVATNPRLHVVHIKELPAGWLGKTHALYKAYEAASGEWLLFTDADVRFSPDAVGRAVALVKERKLDHLTLFCDVEKVGFWETLLITFFGLGFHLATDAARVNQPGSTRYVGIGAFQMVKREAYEKSGTHQRLAMEVVDDMKLGKIVKLAGCSSGCAVAQDFISVRWHAGLGNLVRGVTKNFFAGMGFRLWLAAAGLVGLMLVNILPFLGVIFCRGWMQVFAAVAVFIALVFHGGVAIVMRASPLYAFTHPIGAALFCYMLLRSTVVTQWQGGIVWRDTFYPLDELKRGVV
jgi:glycosyltransferase involved in cell wall biosynthesis